MTEMCDNSHFIPKPGTVKWKLELIIPLEFSIDISLPKCLSGWAHV